MLTQDVLALADGASATTALCTSKGTLVATATVARSGDRYWLDLEPGLARPVAAVLEKHLIADDAEVEDVRSRWALLELWGPGHRDVAARAGVDLSKAWEARLGNLAGSALLQSRERLAEAWKALCQAGAVPAGLLAREAWRVEGGIPRFGQDMDEHTLPLEANLEAAISYTKGCYLGQEGVARSTYRGHVHWKLGGLALGADPLPVGADIAVGGKPAGRVTSVAWSVRRSEWLALAKLHASAFAPGIRVEVGGRLLATHALPFLG
jgi:folate-binding protein YgfZ